VQQKIYRYIFWIGYFTVLLTTFLPVTGELNKINIGPDAFHIRLDHLLHLIVYFLICMYFLFGLRKGISLFEKYSLLKFVLLILLLATVTEVVQIWVPERAFNLVDLLANLLGVIFGVLVIVFSGKGQEMRDER
jgi:VanZ family protein